jgi:hypothetical protein
MAADNIIERIGVYLDVLLAMNTPEEKLIWQYILVVAAQLEDLAIAVLLVSDQEDASKFWAYEERTTLRLAADNRTITTTFDELCDAYLAWIRPNETKGIPARKRSWSSGDVYATGKLRLSFSGKRLVDITPALVSQCQAHRQASPLTLRAPREAGNH